MLEEMGATHSVCSFFCVVALAANAVLTSSDESAKRYLLPGLASGKTIGTLAFTEDNGRCYFGGIELRVTASGDGWVLDGDQSFVLDEYVVELILVVARTDAGVSLFGARSDADVLARKPLSTLEQTRKMARLDFVSATGWS